MHALCVCACVCVCAVFFLADRQTQYVNTIHECKKLYHLYDISVHKGDPGPVFRQCKWEIYNKFMPLKITYNY